MTMKFSKIFYPALLIIMVALGVAVGIEQINDRLKSKKKEILEIQQGQIADIKSMVQLSTMDIYQEVPVLDTINNKAIFAIQKQKGSIAFDLESLKLDTINDTVRVYLPREIITLRESTEPHSWSVIDTKAVGKLAILRSSKLTNEEENAVKAKIKTRSIRRLYKEGTVRDARKEAVKSMQGILEMMYRAPVVVTDTMPEGYLNKTTKKSK